MQATNCFAGPFAVPKKQTANYQNFSQKFGKGVKSAS